MSYQIFREYNTMRILNLTDIILSEAFYPNRFKSPQYPLKHEGMVIKTFEQIEAEGSDKFHKWTETEKTYLQKDAKGNYP